MPPTQNVINRRDRLLMLKKPFVYVE